MMYYDIPTVKDKMHNLYDYERNVSCPKAYKKLFKELDIEWCEGIIDDDRYADDYYYTYICMKKDQEEADQRWAEEMYEKEKKHQPTFEEKYPEVVFVHTKIYTCDIDEDIPF